MSRARVGRTGMVARRAGPAALDAHWDALAAEAFVGIKEWRLQHPKATFAEIEAAVDERLSTVRARMLADVALASAAANVQATPLVARPACPICTGHGAGTGRLEVRGQHTREVTVTYGKTVALTRDYTVCSVCGTGLFPPR